MPHNQGLIKHQFFRHHCYYYSLLLWNSVEESHRVHSQLFSDTVGTYLLALALLLCCDVIHTLDYMACNWDIINMILGD